MHVQFSGRYRLQVFHGDTDILLKDTGWFDNLITNNGLNLIATGFSHGCYVGSETTTPTEADTSITGVLASTGTASASSVVHSSTTPPYYCAQQVTYAFAIGAIQGTIGQVAIGSSATNLFSKARLAGLDGTPTTLTLAGVDRLSLTYELRQYIRTTDISHTISINGETYNCLNRASITAQPSFWTPSLGLAIGAEFYGGTSVTLYTGGTTPFIGAITVGPSGVAVGNNSGGKYAYSTGSYTRGFYGVWDAGINLVNITATTFGNRYFDNRAMGGVWQSSIEGPTLNKTIYQNLRLEYQYSWSRYTI